MTYVKAIINYLSGFGIAFYPRNAVPSDVTFPYGTVDIGMASWGEAYHATAHLHFWTDSEAVPNAKAVAITKELSDFVDIDCDGGMVSMITGEPKWFASDDETNHEHKHRIINLKIWNFTS